MRRKQILSGELEFPKQMFKILPFTDVEEELVRKFWENLWHNYLREKSLDTVSWFTQFPRKMLFNSLLYHLSKAGWITSSVENNYAMITLNESKLLKWVSKEELINIKFRYKFLKYRLKKTKSVFNNIVQINGKHIPTGLVRKGFQKAGNHTFKYDTRKLSKYVKEIASNLEKGLEASNKDITYQEIIEELIGYYAASNDEFTLGNCLLDSRGRSIFQCSKRILNPVSHKEARALIEVPPQRLTSSAWKNIYAFIAELNGYRGKNWEDKIVHGQSMYIIRQFPEESLHERIWLERIYENIDSYDWSGWYVPIEVDALASQIQLVAVLTNDHYYMERTNLIGEDFKDIWNLPYCSRLHTKKALTPKLYGSSKHPRELWIANNLEFTDEQVKLISKELAIGKFANANKFKDFIIGKVNPKVKMKVKVWNEEFDIECNRFKWEETKQVKYPIYVSESGKIKTVVRTVNLVPDTNQFKRFFLTLLLHNLDSQIANYICESMDWVLPNHDAFNIVEAYKQGELLER